MQRNQASPPSSLAIPWHRGASIPFRVIRQFARAIAKQFRPERIILFGSYAGGTPHADSDVDLLVVMPARNQIDQAMKIRLTCPPSFPLDLIVSTPTRFESRLAEGESFLTEIVRKGKVLYEKEHPRMGSQSRKRSTRGTKTFSRKGRSS